MLDDYLNSLNPKQREAAELGCENALVLAGAGSGKTKVLTTRIALLLSRAMARPSQILAVTFTNKAAREMRDRLSAMVACDLRHLWMGTFHGTAHRILRAHAQEANLPPTFQIIDTADQLSLIRRIMKEAGIDPKLRDPKTVQWSINSYKEQGLRAAAVAAREEDETRVTLYQTYEARCQREGLVDFAELMLRCVELLEGNQLVREHYNDRFKYVLVDEFQDTDSLQFRLIKALCPPKQLNACVFCVGDDDQSIYAFRGAKVGNMSDFVKEYKVEKIIKLEQNYRSTSHILDGANAVIANNKDRMGKNLWTDAGAGEPIRLYRADADMQEARAVVQDILVEKRRGKKYSDFAILYRNNNLSRNFERMLSANGIPYRVYGGLRFFDRQEVKDVVAYLRVLANADDTSLLRIINQPPRGIGGKTLEVIERQSAAEGRPLYSVLCNARSYPALERAEGKLQQFAELIESCAELSRTMPLPEFYDELLIRTGYAAMLEQKGDVESRTRLENVRELRSSILTYLENADAPSLSGFLEEIALYTDIEQYDRTADAVVMMTVHSAKGLEFPEVYLVGAEDGLFPSARAIGEPEEMEEERRLCYVAITRAKRRLTITCAHQRMLYGRTTVSRPSRFLAEIPEELVERKQHTQPRFVQQAKPRPRPTMPHSDTLGSHHASGPVIDFRKGDTVEHDVFGRGLVLSVLPTGNDKMLEIAFDQIGTKRLMANFAASRMKKL